jgi:sortase A
MRGLVRPLLNLLIVAGLVLAAWPVGQTLYGLWSQRSLASQWQPAKKAAAPLTKPKAAPKAKPTRQAASLDSDSPAAGLPAPRKKRQPWSLTKFSIPDIDLETFVVQGTDPAALRRGPGHDPNSSLPGSGNCVIAGHRNVYGSFFYRLDELMPGAIITMENRDGKWNYLVNSVYQASAADLSVLDPPTSSQSPILTLITCTLPHSSDRIIVRADLQVEE